MKLYHNKYQIADTTKYVVDYVCENPVEYDNYSQIVKVADDAILFSSTDIVNIKAKLFEIGINKNEVSFI